MNENVNPQTRLDSEEWYIEVTDERGHLGWIAEGGPDAWRNQQHPEVSVNADYRRLFERPVLAIAWLFAQPIAQDPNLKFTLHGVTRMSCPIYFAREDIKIGETQEQPAHLPDHECG